MPPPREPVARIDRLDLLARVLRDRAGITAADLAAELHVSIRTLFRDLAHLRERGYPVESTVGRGGGLRLHASWGLGRVLLKAEEALAALLALAVAERLDFPMLRGEVERARRKIVDAFPTAERRRIAPLRERVFIGPNASAPVRASYGRPLAAPLLSLQKAFVGEQVVRATYQKLNDERVDRRLEPHALVVNWPAWYLLAFDLDRGEPRTFRFDRFASVTAETTQFRARPRDLARDLLEAGVAIKAL